MYAYIFESSLDSAQMVYGRMEATPAGLLTYQSLAATHVAIENTPSKSGLIVPERFSPGERHMAYHLAGEGLKVPTQVDDLESLVTRTTGVWRDLLKDSTVLRVETEYGGVTREVTNKIESGLFLPLDDEQPAVEFVEYHATTEEIASIEAIENNIIAMSTDRSVPGDFL